MTHYVIIGASHAGVSFAEKMRQQGNTDPITMIDKIAGIPLQRPPLSKAYLATDDSADDDEAAFHLRGSDWFAAQDITLLDGVAVNAIDRGAKSLQLDNGTVRTVQSYDKLVLAVGASARHLPMAEHDATNLFVLRDGTDARRLKAAMAHAKRAVVIGGGYIGLEAAASMRKQGLDVHVVEAAPRLLARVASPEISAAYQALHEGHGVAMHIGTGVAGLQAQDGIVRAVTLGNGDEIACDLVLAGIGVVPETKLAEDAGLAIGNGILTDYHYATDDEAIFAIGDNVLAEGRLGMRIESIHNAQYGGHYLASRFNDAPLPHEEAPWFWSDQYDRKLQSAGIVPAPADDVCAAIRAGKREGGQSVWSYQGGRLMAVESINDPQAYMIGKLCLEKGISPDMAQISDPAFALKSLR